MTQKNFETVIYTPIPTSGLGTIKQNGQDARRNITFDKLLWVLLVVLREMLLYVIRIIYASFLSLALLLGSWVWQGASVLFRGVVRQPRVLLDMAILSLLVYIVAYKFDKEVSLGWHAPARSIATSPKTIARDEASMPTLITSASRNVVSLSTKLLFNPQAPANIAEMNDADNRAYIAAYTDIAVREMHSSGIPASVSMAQGLLESHAGKSVLARRIRNHFGIKCFSNTCRKGHCINFSDDSHKDFFVAYPSPNDSWHAHSLFLQREHYRPLFKFGKDYRAWANGLQNLGYATAPTYAKSIVQMIERYHLEALDKD